MTTFLAIYFALAFAFLFEDRTRHLAGYMWTWPFQLIGHMMSKIEIEPEVITEAPSKTLEEKLGLKPGILKDSRYDRRKTPERNNADSSAVYTRGETSRGYQKCYEKDYRNV